MDENNTDDKQKIAKKYSRIHQILEICETVLFYIILLILIFSGLSIHIQNYSYSILSNPYLALLIFTGIIGIAEGIINFPLNFYSDYILEHKYNLSNQTIFIYFKEKMKGLAVGLVLGIPLLLAFYYILRNFGNNWWIVLGIFIFLF